MRVDRIDGTGRTRTTLLNYTAVAVCGGERDCVCVKRGKPFATNIDETGRNSNDVLSLGGFV